MDREGFAVDSVDLVDPCCCLRDAHAEHQHYIYPSPISRSLPPPKPTLAVDRATNLLVMSSSAPVARKPQSLGTAAEGVGQMLRLMDFFVLVEKRE